MRGVVNEVMDSDLGLGKGALLGIKSVVKEKPTMLSSHQKTLFRCTRRHSL